eukprot:snap_masked-scaffold_18-processed-gene-3.37-mRNA-1 protein AED:1.00 eAED:1.00 QI:0/0/0/0/1/1/3/0/376
MKEPSKFKHELTVIEEHKLLRYSVFFRITNKIYENSNSIKLKLSHNHARTIQFVLINNEEAHNFFKLNLPRPIDIERSKLSRSKVSGKCILTAHLPFKSASDANLHSVELKSRLITPEETTIETLPSALVCRSCKTTILDKGTSVSLAPRTNWTDILPSLTCVNVNEYQTDDRDIALCGNYKKSEDSSIQITESTITMSNAVVDKAILAKTVQVHTNISFCFSCKHLLGVKFNGSNHFFKCNLFCQLENRDLFKNHLSVEGVACFFLEKIVDRGENRTLRLLGRKGVVMLQITAVTSSCAVKFMEQGEFEAGMQVFYEIEKFNTPVATEDAVQRKLIVIPNGFLKEVAKALRLNRKLFWMNEGNQYDKKLSFLRRF